MDNLAKVKILIAAAKLDGDKFYNKGNAAAETRLRKTMQEIKTVAQSIREEVRHEKSK